MIPTGKAVPTGRRFSRLLGSSTLLSLVLAGCLVNISLAGYVSTLKSTPSKLLASEPASSLTLSDALKELLAESLSSNRTVPSCNDGQPELIPDSMGWNTGDRSVVKRWLASSSTSSGTLWTLPSSEIGSTNWKGL